MFLGYVNFKKYNNYNKASSLYTRSNNNKVAMAKFVLWTK
jgi:hypothetical protein